MRRIVTRSAFASSYTRGKWGQSKLSCCARALSGNRAASANPIQRGGDVFRVHGGELDLLQPGLPIPSVMDHQILAGILAAGLVGVAILSVRPGGGLSTRLRDDLASFETRLSALLRMRQVVDGSDRFTSS